VNAYGWSDGVMEHWKYNFPFLHDSITPCHRITIPDDASLNQAPPGRITSLGVFVDQDDTRQLVF
jgi:hypothetical protein